ncbi:MAG: FeoB small GTPase domain-containing protein [Christensenellaceae bacterium]
MTKRKRKERRKRENSFDGKSQRRKTTLFNALTGAHNRTGNYHGVTVGSPPARLPNAWDWEKSAISPGFTL